MPGIISCLIVNVGDIEKTRVVVNIEVILALTLFCIQVFICSKICQTHYVIMSHDSWLQKYGL